MVPLLLLSVLFVAGLVLVGESRLRRRAGSRTLLRARFALYFAASASGTALLIASTGGEWVLILALAPLTLLAMSRMMGIMRQGRADTRTSLVVALLLGATVWACLEGTPQPLDRQTILEQIRYRDGAPSLPDSIDPAAFRPVQA